jgi:HD-like signal output (HDOD) protein
MPLIAQRILASAPRADIDDLSAIIQQDPALCARLIGLANSAYFGWPGGIHTIRDAIYRVLGLKLVVSLAMGLVLNKALHTDRCRGFRPEQYWFTAIATGIIAQSVYPHIDPSLCKEVENAYLNGLLHNLGVAVLVHLFPDEMTRVFADLDGQPGKSLSTCAKAVLGIDQYMAGGWLARRWHLPEDIITVIDHGEEPGYKGEFWPLVLLVRYCAWQASDLFCGREATMRTDFPQVLGIASAAGEKARNAVAAQIEEIGALALKMSRGDAVYE